MKKQLNKVRHDYIRYANCWEDADILMEGLQVQSGDRVLSIGSGGDNSFSLLANDPELVVAVDVNPVQLQLIELKKAAFLTLSYTNFLAFLGFKEAENRAGLFQKVKKELSEEVALFWEGRMDEIEDGIIYQGKFERYFEMFRKKVLPLIHTQKRINDLFVKKTADEQALFHDNKWSNLRWRMLFKLFFSRTVMGKLGRDPAFLKEVDFSVSSFILGQAKKHLSSTHCQGNYFLEFIMKGRFISGLPHYAREENFELIKSRMDRLVVFNGLAEDAFKDYSGFNKFNLSNIFEYMPPELFQSVAENLAKNGEPSARYAYWNLMVPRKMYKIIPGMKHDNNWTTSMTNKDKGFFYSNVNFDVKL